MTPKIVEVVLPPSRLVGVSCDFVGAMDPNSDAKQMIPPTWERLLALTHANNLDADWALGVMTISATPGKMSYTACVPGDASGATPDGMVEVTFAGGTYVGCEHVGLLDSIGETTAWFYGQYLPTAEHQIATGPHLEIYDERFNPHLDSSIVTICAPISK